MAEIRLTEQQRAAVENRGGSITAAARQGGGTVFTVRLPRAAKEGGDGQ